MIDPYSDRALYRQLADLIRAQITKGELAPGANLPSESTLMQTHNLGRPAVRHALALLRSEGLIATERGRPSYVRTPVDRRQVVLAEGDRLTCRMPIDDERKTLGMDVGVPVIDIRHSNGHTDTHPADQVVIEPASITGS